MRIRHRWISLEGYWESGEKIALADGEGMYEGATISADLPARLRI